MGGACRRYNFVTSQWEKNVKNKEIIFYRFQAQTVALQVERLEMLLKRRTLN
jgi:hypothetical protein